jgi:hypothetical protein
MFPQDVFEYRQRWMRLAPHPVRIHSDLRNQAREYCKVQMHTSQWGHKQYTAVYEDTFYFQHPQDATAFRNYFKDWIND